MLINSVGGGGEKEKAVVFSASSFPTTGSSSFSSGVSQSPGDPVALINVMSNEPTRYEHMYLWGYCGYQTWGYCYFEGADLLAQPIEVDFVTTATGYEDQATNGFIHVKFWIEDSKAGAADGEYRSYTLYMQVLSTDIPEDMRKTSSQFEGALCPVTTQKVVGEFWELGACDFGRTVYLNVGGVKTPFRVVQQGKPSDIYDDSCDGTWLMAQNIYELRPFSSDGGNAYQNSAMHEYLNTTFLNLLDESVRNVIREAKLPYSLNGTVISGANGLAAKVFIPSAREVGWTTGTSSYVDNDGARLDYFQNSGTYFNKYRVAKLDGAGVSWFTRSPAYGTSGFVNGVADTGAHTTLSAAATYAAGVRPTIILPSDTLLTPTFSLRV